MLLYGNIDVSFDGYSSQPAACAPRGMRLIIRDDWPLMLLVGDVGPMVPTVLLSLMDTGPTAIPSSIQIIACRQHMKNRLALLQQDFSTTSSAFTGDYTCRLFALLTDKLQFAYGTQGLTLAISSLICTHIIRYTCPIVDPVRKIDQHVYFRLLLSFHFVEMYKLWVTRRKKVVTSIWVEHVRGLI
jgi:hypothetical protein